MSCSPSFFFHRNMLYTSQPSPTADRRPRAWPPFPKKSPSTSPRNAAGFGRNFPRRPRFFLVSPPPSRRCHSTSASSPCISCAFSKIPITFIGSKLTIYRFSSLPLMRALTLTHSFKQRDISRGLVGGGLLTYYTGDRQRCC